MNTGGFVTLCIKVTFPHISLFPPIFLFPLLPYFTELLSSSCSQLGSVCKERWCFHSEKSPAITPSSFHARTIHIYQPQRAKMRRPQGSEWSELLLQQQLCWGRGGLWIEKTHCWVGEKQGHKGKVRNRELQIKKAEERGEQLEMMCKLPAPAGNAFRRPAGGPKCTKPGGLTSGPSVQPQLSTCV